MSARRTAVLLFDDSPSQIALIPTAFEELLQFVSRLFSIPSGEVQVFAEASGRVAAQAAYEQTLSQPGPLTLRVTRAVSRVVEDYVLGFESVHRLRLLRVSDNSVSTLELPELDWTGRVCLHGEEVLFVGGQGNPRGACLFSILRGSRKVLGDMKEGRVWHGLSTAAAHAIVVGGKDPTEGGTLKSTESLDGEQWTSLDPLNFPRESHSLISHRDSLYAVGGFDGTHRLQSIEAYKHRKWVMIPVRLPEPRQMAGLVFLDDIKLMVVGGHDNDRPVDSVYLLDLNSGKVEVAAPLPVSDYFTGRQLVKKPTGEVWGFGKHDYIYFPGLGAWASSQTSSRSIN